MTGGMYMRFQVGSAGGSAAHIRYISRPAALRDGKDAVLLHNLPEAANEESLTMLRDHLFAYAWLREKAELRIERGHGSGQLRSYYRATIGFEQSIENKEAHALIKEWLDSAFPNAQAVAFLHRDTPHLHAHIWIGAREISGKKIQINFVQYRSLDEEWNRIYSHAMGRAIGEYLKKKDETLRARHEKVRGRHDPDPKRAERVDYRMSRSQFHTQELRNAGHDELAKITTGGIESAPTRDASNNERGERSTSLGESTTERGADIIKRTEREAERAISEISGLRGDASRLGSREALEQTAQISEIAPANHDKNLPQQRDR